VRANRHLADLVRGHADRLAGFAVVDPRDPQAPLHLRHAVETLGLVGAKMVPTGWYPYDADVQPVFAEARRLGIPLLFHSGIFIDGRSGRFCRPAFFEVMRDHPGTRVALAHLGWPWTDEAIAVGLIDRIHGVPADQAQFRLDISFGPPPPYRLEVLSRALEVLGAESLQFGSDCFLPCPGAQIAERRRWVQELLDELGLDAAARERIWSGTAAAWLGLPRPPETPRFPGATLDATPAALPDTPPNASPSTSPNALPNGLGMARSRRACVRPLFPTASALGPRRMAPYCC